MATRRNAKAPARHPSRQRHRRQRAKPSTLRSRDFPASTRISFASSGGAASQRDDHCLVPPAGPKRSPTHRAVAKLLEAGLVKEMRAKAGAPIWRRDDETGQTYALKLTAAGAKAIAVDEAMPSESVAERRSGHPIVSVDRKPEPSSDPAAAIDRPNSGVATTPTSPRGGRPSGRWRRGIETDQFGQPLGAELDERFRVQCRSSLRPASHFYAAGRG